MILSILGIIGLIISVLIILIGLIKKSRKLKRVGIGIGIVPVFCFGLIAFWYMIAIPSLNKSEFDDFSGIYTLNESAEKLLSENGLLKKKHFLILKSNGTYTFDSITGIKLRQSGKWKTGGIDGNFMFYDNNGNLIDFGMPSGSGNSCGLSFQFRPNKDDFLRTQDIYLKKIKSE